MKRTHNPKLIKEQATTEGKTYLAEIVKCPWAYRKIPDQKSTVGKIVRVTMSRVVNIQWDSGAENSIDRSCVKIIGEVL